VPSHMKLDHQTRQFFVVDSGHDRMLVVNTTAGERGEPLTSRDGAGALDELDQRNQISSPLPQWPSAASSPHALLSWFWVQLHTALKLAPPSTSMRMWMSQLAP